MATSNIEHLEQLFNQRRYAEVMLNIAATETDPELGALRADAQDYFKAGLNRMSEVYQELCGTQPPTSAQEEALRVRYDQDVGAIFEPLEAETYARALLREAEHLEMQGKERTEILIRIYAARALPLQNLALEHQLDQERTRLERQPMPVPAPREIQPVPRLYKTVTLPETTQDRAQTNAASVEALQHQLAALLARPLYDWLPNEISYDQQVQQQRAQLQAIPGDHTALLRQIDSQYTRLKTTLKTLKDTLAQLPRAADEDLYLSLLEIEAQLGSDYPDLEPFQQRREAYLARLQQTLNELDAELRQPQVDLVALQQRITTLRQPADKSLLKGLYEKLDQQLTARRETVTALNQVLQQPITAWLANAQLHDQARELLADITARFDADSALVKDLRTRFNQRVAEGRDVHARLQGLANLEGVALVTELSRLEALLGPNYAQLRPHQQRRTQYEAEQQRQQVAAQRAARQSEIRQLRTEFDTALKSYLSTPDILMMLREKAQTASMETSLDPSAHPFNSEVFSYYDVLWADYRYNLEQEAFVAARTAANMGDWISAVEILENNLVAAQKSDNDRDLGLAQHALDKALKDLIEQTQREIAKALVEARALLATYDYAAALNELTIQQTNLERAHKKITIHIPIDEALLNELDTEIANAKGLEQLGQQAAALEQQAQDAAPEASETPNYPQAIALLQQAGTVATWRKPELDEAIAALRHRQDKFVLQCIARAATETRMENYTAAAEWLQRADRNAVTEEQRRQINDQHTTIHAQQKNVERYDTIINALQAILDEGRKGENIEQLRPRIARYRAEIGTHDQPKFDDTRWAELDDYLRQADAQLQAWNTYITLRRHAEAAAVNGDMPQVTETLRQMSEMSTYTFLPIQRDTTQIRSMAGTGERAERVRALLTGILTRLEADEHAVTDEEIDNAVRLSAGFTQEYQDIGQDHQFLTNLLPLYRARAELKGYIEDERFEQVAPTIATLPEQIQADATIRQYKRKAEICIAEREFQKELSNQLNGLKGIFDYAWDDPQQFQARIQSLSHFAEQAAPDRRSTNPKLAVDAIAQLNDLAEKILVSRRQFDQEAYTAALNSLNAISVMLPDSSADTSKALAAYSNELSGLKVQIEVLKPNIESQMAIKKTRANDFEKALEDYQINITDSTRYFNPVALQQTINALVQTHDTRAAAYVTPLRTIKTLLEEVDNAFGLFISGADDRDDEPVPSGPPAEGSPRAALIAQRLTAARRQSDAIKQPGGNAEDWPGIRHYPPYQILRNLQDVAVTLDAADHWLRQTDNLPAEQAKLKKLHASGKDLVGKLDQAKQMVRNELEQHQQLAPTVAYQLPLIQNSCEEKQVKIHKRVVDQIEPRWKQQEQKHTRTRALVIITLVMAAIIGTIWYIPTLEPVKNSAIAFVMGTPTPTPRFTPTPTAVPGAAPTWTAVVVTATPAPTATPIPPQAGVIVFPGRAWTYALPSLGAERRTYIEGGLSVEVTGFTEDNEASRWYRINAADIGLTNVWVLHQIVFEMDRQPRETIRFFDNNNVVNEALFIPFDQAMQ